MLKKNLKIMVLSFILVLSFATVALADIQTGTFYYNTKPVSYTLSVDWSVLSYDDGMARTEWSPNYVNRVSAYLEATDISGNLLGVDFDYGYTWGEGHLSKQSVWRYNSTHAVTDPNNVYITLASAHLTDW